MRNIQVSGFGEDCVQVRWVSVKQTKCIYVFFMETCNGEHQNKYRQCTAPYWSFSFGYLPFFRYLSLRSLFSNNISLRRKPKNHISVPDWTRRLTCSLLAHIQQIFRIQLSSGRVVHLYTFYQLSWQELLMFIASKYPCIVMSDLVRPVSNLSAIWSQFNRDKWHRLNSHHSPGSATRTPIKHAAISLPNKGGPTCHHLEIDDWY